MESPFPGVDPFIEQSGLWPDFHHDFISELRRQLAEHLPANYIPRIDERGTLIEVEDGPGRPIVPDVALLRDPETPARRGGPAAGVGLLEPTSVSLPRPLVETRVSRVEIRRSPDLALVTAIEVLSPTHKSDWGYYDFLAKREALFRARVNLIELDLLLGGRRPPMGGVMPPGDAYALVSRATRNPNCDVYAWSIRRSLPRLPIPLADGDPDVILELASIPAIAYKNGRYGNSIRYDSPLTLPLSPDDRAWAEALDRAPRA